MRILRELAAIVSLGLGAFALGGGLWLGWKSAHYFFAVMVCAP